MNTYRKSSCPVGGKTLVGAHFFWILCVAQVNPLSVLSGTFFLIIKEGDENKE